MSGLVEFLLARIAEDEAAVNERTTRLSPACSELLEQFGDFGGDERWMIEIPAARVLATCKAHRAIIELHERIEAEAKARPLRYALNLDSAAISDALYAIASIYADHPDYAEAVKS